MNKTEIPLFKVFMAPEAGEEVSKVLYSGFIGQGPIVDRFEKEIESSLGVSRALTLNSGTAGLHLALHLLKRPTTESAVFDGMASYQSSWPGIQDGDEVLATALTCTASNFPILANNLKIKWVDIDPTTLNISLADLESKITERTKVIMLVHWGGYPNDLNALKAIQERARAKFGFAPAIIEDGAHSFGSKFSGKALGNHGNMVMHSLQAIKHITSVDGGILILPNQELYDRAQLLRWYGIDRNSNRKDFRCEADIPEWGFKFHMNDVNATIGSCNLRYAADVIGKHQSNAAYYDKFLQGIPGLTTLTRHSDRESAFWIYSMLVEDREGFYEKMKECNIVVSQVHERNDKHSCVAEYKSALPVLDSIIRKVVSIPVGWWVTEEQREYIVDCIKRGW
jgi:dTDP-4-amino-4,6-dideoxygalactose transaminase